MEACSACGRDLPSGTLYCLSCGERRDDRNTAGLLLSVPEASPVTYCDQCGVNTFPGDRHCRNCGALVPAVCTKCLRANPEGSEYCGWCGEAMNVYTRQHGLGASRLHVPPAMAAAAVVVLLATFSAGYLTGRSVSPARSGAMQAWPGPPIIGIPEIPDDESLPPIATTEALPPLPTAAPVSRPAAQATPRSQPPPQAASTGSNGGRSTREVRTLSQKAQPATRQAQGKRVRADKARAAKATSAKARQAAEAKRIALRRKQALTLFQRNEKKAAERARMYMQKNAEPAPSETPVAAPDS